ncbi:unnamed protein product, partial [Ectocarpus sp. 12 AP-2014]
TISGALLAFHASLYSSSSVKAEARILLIFDLKRFQAPAYGKIPTYMWTKGRRIDLIDEYGLWRKTCTEFGARRHANGLSVAGISAQKVALSDLVADLLLSCG